MSVYNVIEYSNIYSMTFGSLWQYCSDEPYVDINSAIVDFPANNNNSASFYNNVTRCVKIMVPLKCLSNFWRTLGMSLINCEINLILTWFANCFIIDDPVNDQVPTFAKLIQNVMFQL